MDAKNKGVLRAFDSLDESIRGGGVDDETFAWIADSLMMGSINLHCSAVKNFVQQRAAQQVDYVSVRIVSGALLMLSCIGKLRRDILIKRASKHDIDGLRAAADPKHRQVSPKTQSDRFHLGKGSLGFDLAQFCDRVLAVMTRINIETSTANQ